MFVCPTCNAQLSRVRGDAGVFWACPRCGGRALALALLRKTAAKGYVNRLWRSARDAKGAAGRRCPVCDKPMVEVPTASDAKALKLDVCLACQFVWFDPKEYEGVQAAAPQGGEEPELPLEARTALAMAQVERIAERARENAPEPTFDEWKFWPAVFGLPVELAESPLRRAPWLTWALAAMVSLVSIVAFLDLRTAVEVWGLVPATAGRYGGLTLLTSFLLHGGVIHLVENLYFLLIFGDNVEDYLGRWRYLGLILAAAIVGDLLHIAMDPRSQDPLIGASGGIAGVITFYALKFPHVRLGVRVGFVVLFRWCMIPAWSALVLWVLLQLLGAWQQLTGLTDVSALAHLGGAAAGFAFWLVWRMA